MIDDIGSGITYTHKQAIVMSLNSDASCLSYNYFSNLGSLALVAGSAVYYSESFSFLATSVTDA